MIDNPRNRRVDLGQLFDNKIVTNVTLAFLGLMGGLTVGVVRNSLSNSHRAPLEVIPGCVGTTNITVTGENALGLRVRGIGDVQSVNGNIVLNNGGNRVQVGPRVQAYDEQMAQADEASSDLYALVASNAITQTADVPTPAADSPVSVTLSDDRRGFDVQNLPCK